jgi:hypothetical protein
MWPFSVVLGKSGMEKREGGGRGKLSEGKRGPGRPRHGEGRKAPTAVFFFLNLQSQAKRRSDKDKE